ncbi:hypothetical protein [Rhizobium leguminosarum]|jgi:hypothetical protein|uniref:hypothetical protein n=1 Tax=Rhizobium leguminosarum TaxID=384 RepID=UPI002F947120
MPYVWNAGAHTFDLAQKQDLCRKNLAAQLASVGCSDSMTPASGIGRMASTSAGSRIAPTRKAGRQTATQSSLIAEP